MKRLLAALVCVAACGAEDVCLFDVAIPPETAEAVQVEVVGDGAAGRAVFVHAVDGTLIYEGATDDGGSLALPAIPGDATVTIDAEDRLLVSYVGLRTGDTLVVPRTPSLEETGSAMVTVRWQPLADPSVRRYLVSLGAACGWGEAGATDTELTVEARCPGRPAYAIVMADGDFPEQSRYLGAAGAALEVDDGASIDVDAGPWETAIAEIEVVAEPNDLALVQHADRDGWAYQVFEGLVDGPFEIPDAPALFDRVEIELHGLGDDSNEFAGYVSSIADPADLRIDVADFLPPVTGLGLERMSTGAPTMQWAYAGPQRAAIARYKIEETEVVRLAIRVDGGCHVTFPPLPPGYESFVPPAAEDFHADAQLTIVDAAVDRDAAPSLLFPSLLPGVAIYTRTAHEHVTIRE